MKIKIKDGKSIEEQFKEVCFDDKQAQVIGAVVRGLVSDIVNERDDVIKFMTHGVKYKLTITKGE